MTPTFSIVIPCFNQGQFLADALESVLHQTYPHWECIIVNDNSPDETELIAKKYLSCDNRFKYLLTTGGGVSFARNEGVDFSSGEFILPLDADDKIGPTYLEKALLAFTNNPSLKLVYGEAEFFGNKSGKWHLPEYSYYELLLMNIIYCSAVFRKTDFISIGGYATDLIYGLEDWDFWLRLLKNDGKVYRLSDVVFFYRKKEISRSTELMKEERLNITEKQLLNRNKENYFKYLHNIIKDLEQCRSEKKELIRQLNLLKNSRSQRLIGKVKSLVNFGFRNNSFL